MDTDTKILISVIFQILCIVFMIGSGIWVALDARKHGKPPVEFITWGVFAGWFIGLGLIAYFLWRKYVYQKTDNSTQ